MSYVVVEDEEEEEVLLPPMREEDARGTLPLTEYYKKQKKSERYESIKKQTHAFERTLRREELERKRKRICFTYEGTRYCDKKRCIQDLVIRGVLGRGSYGEVHFATVRGNPSTKYVVKITEMNSDYDDSDFEREVDNQEIASEVGAAPIVKKAFKCKVEGVPFAFIVMERYDMSLDDYIADYDPPFEAREALRVALTEKLKMMHDAGVSHGDIHSGNIVVSMSKTDPQVIKDAVFIDFGLSRNLTTIDGSWATYLEKKELEQISKPEMWQKEPRVSDLPLPLALVQPVEDDPMYDF